MAGPVDVHHLPDGPPARADLRWSVLAQCALAAAVYGFSVGRLHSLRLAVWNLAKFPMLILLTCLLCAPAWCLAVRLIAWRLPMPAAVGISVRVFRDLSVLLASLSPVCLFLALTVTQPDAYSLNEYPLFLGLNVLLIALCGTAALARQATRLLRRYRIPARRAAAVVLTWLALSLFVGGQCAWYLRPFFGPRMIEHIPFIEGDRPDYRGAANFYEAVWHLIDPPPLPRRYQDHNAPHPSNPPPPRALRLRPGPAGRGAAISA